MNLKTVVNNTYEVSTVSLMVPDYCGRPFETIVFKYGAEKQKVTDHTDLDCSRYDTAEEAVYGHNEMILRWKTMRYCHKCGDNFKYQGFASHYKKCVPVCAYCKMSECICEEPDATIGEETASFPLMTLQTTYKIPTPQATCRKNGYFHAKVGEAKGIGRTVAEAKANAIGTWMSSLNGVYGVEA